MLNINDLTQKVKAFFDSEIPNEVISLYRNVRQKSYQLSDYDCKIDQAQFNADLVGKSQGFIFHLIKYCTFIIVDKHKVYVQSRHYEQDFAKKLLILILKNEVEIEEKDIISICSYLSETVDPNVYYQDSHYHFPYIPFINFIEKKWSNRTLSHEFEAALYELHRKNTVVKDDILFNERLERLINTLKSDGSFNLAQYFHSKDEVGNLLYAFYEKQKQNPLFEEISSLMLIEEFDRNTPSKKWEKRAEILIQKLDKTDWINLIIGISDITISHLENCHRLKNIFTHDFNYGGSGGYGNNNRWFSAKNEAIIRRLVWLLPHLSDSKELVEKVSDLGLIAYKKYSGVGGLLPSVGSACMYALTNLPNQGGIVYLTKYKQKIANQTINKSIEKYLNELASKSGKTQEEIEEEAVPTFDFDKFHAKIVVLGDYKATISLISNTKIQTTWYDANEKAQKAIPSVLKEKYAQEVKTFNATLKHIQEQLTTQAKRLEDIYLLDRSWQYENWKKLYDDTGILSFLGQKIIWEFEDEGTKQTGIAHNGIIVNAQSTPLSISAEKTIVRLWHPVTASMNEVEQWRDFIFQNSIVQPFKQAYRELYLITDAELNTASYSNRFAAHILKNYQFGALCKTRDWLGYNAFHHDGSMPCKKLKKHNIVAQYWVNGTNTNDYTATDKVCFVRNNVRLDLWQIPAIVFSEIMRDVDMFVAVCSVGSDAAWRDNGGQHQYHTYWESYSFGNLNETAKLRKSILEKILPKLKIAKVAHLEDKFLVVKGTFRSYKIHLGSTNILMTPNDQYLCIVPDRSKPKDENIYLPFEGDAGLSVIISKAFLLAADDKITDSTIMRQIIMA